MLLLGGIKESLGASQQLLSAQAFTNFFFTFAAPSQFGSNNLRLYIKDGALLTNLFVSGSTNALSGTLYVLDSSTVKFGSNGATFQDITGTKSWNFQLASNATTVARLMDVTNIASAISSGSIWQFPSDQFTTNSNTPKIVDGALTTNLVFRGSGLLLDSSGTLKLAATSRFSATNGFYIQDGGATRTWNFKPSGSEDGNTVATWTDVTNKISGASGTALTNAIAVANQTTVSVAAQTLTVGTVQDIGTGSSPTFYAVTLTGGTGSATGKPVLMLDGQHSGSAITNTVAETTAYTYTIPANTLSADYTAIEFSASGYIINAASTTRVRVKLAGTTIFDTGNLTTATGNMFRITGDFIVSNVANVGFNGISWNSTIATLTSSAAAGSQTFLRGNNNDLVITITNGGTTDSAGTQVFQVKLLPK